MLGAVLPSFVIILAIAMIFQDWKELPAVEAAFKGIRPAVVALIAAPLFKMAKTALKTTSQKPFATNHSPLALSFSPLAISLAAALLIWLGHVNPVWVILATILLTLVAVDIKERRRK